MVRPSGSIHACAFVSLLTSFIKFSSTSSKRHVTVIKFVCLLLKKWRTGVKALINLIWSVKHYWGRNGSYQPYNNGVKLLRQVKSEQFFILNQFVDPLGRPIFTAEIINAISLFKTLFLKQMNTSYASNITFGITACGTGRVDHWWLLSSFHLI